ncbi:MAG: 16S rRNA (guanine(527)-N(7))-methyltransferase RsmG [Chloroflexi bacterium]|nr:MAG: 16S rRNA (guanine(527)-N(7))-methyltransferase RsmG [Chloroflexota bacterium]
MNWISQAEIFGVRLTQEQTDQFVQYESLLLEWNQKINLTAVREPSQIQQRHFLDSLTCVQVMGDLNGRSVIDVGTGAGFPGLALKIMFPQMQLTLVESVRKKTRFLEAVIEALQMSTVSVVVDRAELVGKLPAYREQFDWAVARALADMRVLVEYLLPLCKVGGKMLAQKGPHAPVELEQAQRAIQILGGGAATLQPVKLPAYEDPRYLVVVPKVGLTPEKYPRRVGIPTKRPL